MLLRHTDMTLRPLGEGYLVALSEEYEYPGPWQDERSIQTNGACAVQVSCVTDTGDLALRIEVHDQDPGLDTSLRWQFGPEDAVLRAETDEVILAIPCQGDLSEQWPDDEPPLGLPAGTASKPQEFQVRLYGRADSTETGVGDRGEHHLLQLWPAADSPSDDE